MDQFPVIDLCRFVTGPGSMQFHCICLILNGLELKEPCLESNLESLTRTSNNTSYKRFPILHGLSSPRNLFLFLLFTLAANEAMSQKAKNLARKKTTPEAHRTTVKRIAQAVNERLDVPISDELDQHRQALHVSKFRQQRGSLRSKLETLKVLDEDILSNVEDENIEEKIQEADLVSELIQLSITRIDDFLETSRPPQRALARQNRKRISLQVYLHYLLHIHKKQSLELNYPNWT